MSQAAMLRRSIQRVMPLVRKTGLLASLVTIQQPDGTYDAAGAPSYTYTDVVGLVDIPCMDAPLGTDAIQATETKALADIMSAGFRHVLLDGYYPQVATLDDQIPTNWRAVVDGVVYDILGVEHDSQNQMTRLRLRLVQV